jgi:hypothetical protein
MLTQVTGTSFEQKRMGGTVQNQNGTASPLCKMQDGVGGSSSGHPWRSTAAPDPFFWGDRNERAATSAVRRDINELSYHSHTARASAQRSRFTTFFVQKLLSDRSQLGLHTWLFFSPTEGGPEAAARFPERSLLLCWPPDEVSRPPSTLQRRSLLLVSVLQLCMKTALNALL